MNVSDHTGRVSGATTAETPYTRLRVHAVVMRQEAMMFYVEIIKSSSGEVVKRMGPMPERKAEKVEICASINLNHDEYFTRIVSA